MSKRRTLKQLTISGNISLSLGFALSLLLGTYCTPAAFAQSSTPLAETGDLQALTPKMDDSQPATGADTTANAPSDTAGSAPLSPKELMKKGLQLTSEHKWNEASETFKEVLGQDPYNLDAYFNLGAIAENQGDLQNALSFYEGAQSLNPNDSGINDAVASVQKSLGIAAAPHRYSGSTTTTKGPDEAAGQITPFAPSPSVGSIPGAPNGYQPSPSYYGTSNPPASIANNDPSYEAYQKMMKKQHNRDVRAKLLRAAAAAGVIGVFVGLSFL